jgi:PAT family beta-lactamase induction signal transducer AmpG
MHDRSPSLSTSAPLRYATFGALYLAQGIPQGLQLFAIPAWMAMQGVDAAVVGGYIGICTLPWTFKIVAGPLMDRYSFLAMGRRRPWLLGAQLGLLIMMLAMAFVPDPLNNMGLFMSVSFVLNCFGAFQDVATDGLAVDITPVDQQARANGVMWGAKVVGVSLTLLAGTWAINTYGFRIAVVGLSMVMLLLLILPSILRERQGERVFPWSKGSPSPEALGLKAETWGEILFTLRSAFLLRGSLIGALCFFLNGTAMGLKDAMMPVFTVQRLAWTNSDYADLTAGASVASAVCAMVLAGWLADRVGKTCIISIYSLLIAMGWTTLAFTPQHWATSGYFTTSIYAIQFLETFCIVAVLATAMNLCWTRVAATQFTLYMVCNNMGLVVAASLLGPLRAHLDWSAMFLVMAGLLVAAAVLIRFVHLGTHLTALGELEADFAAEQHAAPVPAPVVPSDLGEALVP